MHPLGLSNAAKRLISISTFISIFTYIGIHFGASGENICIPTRSCKSIKPHPLRFLAFKIPAKFAMPFQA